MKESIVKSYDELPLFLNAETLAKVLGIALSSSYELMHQKDFPTLKVGNRLVVPKENFIKWVGVNTKKLEERRTCRWKNTQTDFQFPMRL